MSAEPEIKDLSQLGKLGCPGMSDEEVLTKFGFHAVPQAPIHVIAHDALKWGMCTKPTELRRSYGDWIKNVRKAPATRAQGDTGENAYTACLLHKLSTPFLSSPHSLLCGQSWQLRGI
jgi:hypothetical protein